MSRLMIILMLLPVLVSGQVEYYKSYSTNTGLGDILYAFSFRQSGDEAIAPEVDVQIPAPAYTGVLDTLTHYSGGHSIVLSIDSTPETGTNWTAASSNGTSAPTNFSDELADEGYLMRNEYAPSGFSVTGLLPNRTYQLSMLIVSLGSDGCNDYRVTTAVTAKNYTDSKWPGGRERSTEIVASTDGSGKLWWVIEPLPINGNIKPNLIFYGAYIREK